MHTPKTVFTKGQHLYNAINRCKKAGEYATAFHIIEDNLELLKRYFNVWAVESWEEFLNELEGNRLNEAAWHSFPVQSFEKFAR